MIPMTTVSDDMQQLGVEASLTSAPSTGSMTSSPLACLLLANQKYVSSTRTVQIMTKLAAMQAHSPFRYSGASCDLPKRVSTCFYHLSIALYLT